MDEAQTEPLAAKLRDMENVYVIFSCGGDTPSITLKTFELSRDGLATTVTDDAEAGAVPVETLDNPANVVPDDIVQLCDQYGAEPQVLGCGSDSLHLQLS